MTPPFPVDPGFSGTFLPFLGLWIPTIGIASALRFRYGLPSRQSLDERRSQRKAPARKREGKIPRVAFIRPSPNFATASLPKNFILSIRTSKNP